MAGAAVLDGAAFLTFRRTRKRTPPPRSTTVTRPRETRERSRTRALKPPPRRARIVRLRPTPDSRRRAPERYPAPRTRSTPPATSVVGENRTRGPRLDANSTTPRPRRVVT